MKCPKCNTDGIENTLIINNGEVLAMCSGCRFIWVNPPVPNDRDIPYWEAHFTYKQRDIPEMKVEHGWMRGIRFVRGWNADAMDLDDAKTHAMLDEILGDLKERLEEMERRNILRGRY